MVRSRTEGDVYAEELLEVNRQLIELVESAAAADWEKRALNAPDRDTGEDEQRTLGQVALHVANHHLVQLAIVLGIAEGRIAKPDNPGNAEEAAANPKPDRAEVVAKLTENGTAAAAALRDVPAAAMDSAVTFRGWTMTCRQAIEELLIGHPRWHLASLRATLNSSG